MQGKYSVILSCVTCCPNFNDSKCCCLPRLVFGPHIQSPSASATTSPSLGALSLSLPILSTPHALPSCLGLLLRILWLSASWAHSLWPISWYLCGHDEKTIKMWPRYSIFQAPEYYSEINLYYARVFR